MLNEVEAINRRQMGSKKPVVERENVHFEWQDTSLISLLTKGIERVWQHNVADEVKEAEASAMRTANAIIRAANSGYEYSNIELELYKAIDSSNGYEARRLTDLGIRIVEESKARKGLVIFGEGGIGKTYFLYELVEKLAKINRPYAIAFNQEGVESFSKIGISSIAATCPEGFTLLIDACNELDDTGFASAKKLIEDALLSKNVNVIATTRKESPFSRLAELKALLPCYREFEGVEPYLVFDLISECSEEIIIQFQDMLLSNNPRNLSAMMSMIRKLRPGEDGRSATTQRTALIENCIRDAINPARWQQTKKICDHLYQSGSITFSKEEADRILEDDADAYITDMMTQGFLECSHWKGLTYSFSSESQIRVVIARSFNKELDSLVFDENNPRAFANTVASVVAEKSNGWLEQEIIQVTVDRYCKHGAPFVVMLLFSLQEKDLDVDWEEILTHTVFPTNSNFAEAAKMVDLDPCVALGDYAGFLNTPLNLSYFANEKLLADASAVDLFFRNNWQLWQLQSLIQRVRSIADYVSHSKSIPNPAGIEWAWLSIWCSLSSNAKLRALSQRLLFLVCNKNSCAIDVALYAWESINDVYAKRAISKALPRLDTATKSRSDVQEIVRKGRGNNNLTDSIVISNLCKISNDNCTPTDFSSRNLYEELGGIPITPPERKAFESTVHYIDMISKDFFPFDVHQINHGCLDLKYSGRFMDAEKNAVKEWNAELSRKLHCPAQGECGGLCQHADDMTDFHPVPFAINQLDQSRLLNCMVQIAKKWLAAFGGNLENLLGKFSSSDWNRGNVDNPNLKPLSIACGELMGSLSANYFLSDIVLNSNGYTKCGFEEYEEVAYREPGVIDSLVPLPNGIIDAARAKIARRLVSPEGKGFDWFNDIDEALQEINNVLLPVSIGGSDWYPLAMTTRARIRNERGLERSNELLISSAFDPDCHIDGGRRDRYLTIEHEEFDGNLNDYPGANRKNCLILPKNDDECTVTERNAILLPPPSLIACLNLDYEAKSGCFVDSLSGDRLIVCDGNIGNYYEEDVQDLILIRSDAYKQAIGSGQLTVFVFSERFHETRGYDNACDRHWELSLNDNQVVHYPNHGETYESLSVPDGCTQCYFSDESRHKRFSEKYADVDFMEPDWLLALREEYGTVSE